VGGAAVALDRQALPAWRGWRLAAAAAGRQEQQGRNSAGVVASSWDTSETSRSCVVVPIAHSIPSAGTGRLARTHFPQRGTHAFTEKH